MTKNVECLNKKRVKEFAQNAKKGERLWDARCRGLYMRKNDSSTSYSVKVSISGQSKEVQIARVTDLGLDAARIKADAIRNSANNDPGSFFSGRGKSSVNPVEELTFGELFRRHNKMSLAEGKKAATIEWRERQWVYLEAALQDKLVGDLQYSEVLDQLELLVQEKGLKTAHRARNMLRGLLNYAVKQRIVKTNLASEVKLERVKRVVKNRVLSERELIIILKLVGGESCSRVSLDIRDVIYLLILTGCRLNEICKMTWDEVDLAGKKITIRRERTKTGVAYQVPITPTMERILRRRFKVVHDAARDLSARNCRVFDLGEQTPSQTIRRWTSTNKSTSGSFEAVASAHDLRRTVATKLCVELGKSEIVAEAILNHAPDKSRAISSYVHITYQTKCDVLNEWDEYLRKLMVLGA